MKKRISKIILALLPRGLRMQLRNRLPKAVVQRLARLLGVQQKRRFESRAAEFESKLWGGFSEQALLDVARLKEDEAASSWNRSEAARVLARWWGSRQDHANAYREIVAMRELRPHATQRRLQVLLESECLCALGRPLEARELLSVALDKAGTDVHLELALANTFTDDDAQRIQWINRSLVRAGFVPIHKRDPHRPLAIDNLGATAPSCKVPRDKQPLISVLVPAYGAASTLHIALDSLLAQTWQNLEILVIDDCSVDGTFEVAQEYAKRDSRVRALRTPNNSGAYPARNLGLGVATGEFLTIHDADDWSHPQKLETQVTQLIKHRTAANLTAWVRSSPELRFRGTARRAQNWVYYNTSSLMTKRQTVLDAGGWDPVRVAADTELLRRLHRAFGKHEVPLLHETVPLSFALEVESSLTRSGPTHVFTLYHGARRIYHEAAEHWLESAEPGLVRLPAPGQPRAFPAPKVLLSRNPAPHEVDLLFIMDFALRGGAYQSTMNYVRAALRLGKRVGVFHWKRYDLDVAVPPSSEVRQLAQEGKVSLVSPGEAVNADCVIVGYPVVLRHAIDLPPTISCRKFVIVTNQMSARLYSGGDPQYDPRDVSANVRRLFNQDCSWVPISTLVRELMVKDGRYGPTLDQTWTPLIDTATWCKADPAWRGRSRSKPVVGRHARDHYTKWPTDAEAIRAAYCADRPCTVSLLGGAKFATRIIGSEPRNWDVHPFGSMPSMEFLGGLDFYVHYPHEDYIEEFGRAVLEAMAVGVPVVLPEVFRSTFGEAAIYAAPRDVWPAIERLWKDEQAWLARVQAGRKFVLDNSDWSRFEARLVAL